MPLVSYRANAEAILRWERSDRVVHGLHEIHEVAGHRASAKQTLHGLTKHAAGARCARRLTRLPSTSLSAATLS